MVEVISLLKNEVKVLSDLLKANIRVELGYILHYMNRKENKQQSKVTKLLEKLELVNARITEAISTLDKLKVKNNELEATCKELSFNTNNLNITNQKLLETINGLQKELDQKVTSLSSLQSHKNETDRIIEELTFNLKNESKAKEKAEIDLKVAKEKQEKLVELLHRMEKDRDKKSSSKKEIALAHQCQEMKESIEMLTSKLEEVKEDYDEKIVMQALIR